MFNVWVKSKQGIRIVNGNWESVFSWHIATGHDTLELAEKEATKIPRTAESPSVVVRHDSEPMY